MSGTGLALKLRDASGLVLVTISLNDAVPGGPFALLSDPQHKAGRDLKRAGKRGSQTVADR